MMFEQIQTHMMTHSLYPEFQSAYRKNHSTETAFVRVMNDILIKMNIQEVTLLVMLDLSAAFDTVNHNILLTRLNEELGICGLALEWFRSYLAKKGQRVSIDGSLSERFSLECGVPQGHVWAPCFSSSMHPSYSGWLRTNFHKRFATRMTHRLI